MATISFYASHCHANVMYKLCSLLYHFASYHCQTIIHSFSFSTQLLSLSFCGFMNWNIYTLQNVRLSAFEQKKSQPVAHIILQNCSFPLGIVVRFLIKGPFHQKVIQYLPLCYFFCMLSISTITFLYPIAPNPLFSWKWINIAVVLRRKLNVCNR